jgi:hypothetical protein
MISDGHSVPAPIPDQYTSISERPTFRVLALTPSIFSLTELTVF